MSIYEPTMIIDGSPYTPQRETRVFTSPTTGEPVARIALGTPQDVDAAVAAARRALPEVAGLGVDARAALLNETAARLRARADELAEMLALEHGKTRYHDAPGEIEASAGALEAGGAQARWLTEFHYPLSTPGKRLITHRRPRGVYGVLTPWNFPLGIITQYYLGPGLAAGNTMVWVGSPSVNGVHAVLAEIVNQVWPTGTLNFITGDGAVVGQAVAGHPDVDAVGFTGSSKVAKQVMIAAAGKPSFIEAGGNGPTIVLADADIARAARCIAMGSFTNAGQICTSTGRIIVDAAIAAELADAIAAESATYRIGDPRAEETTMGPVHTEALATEILRQVTDAADHGARIVVGGRVQPGAPTPNYIEPTVVDGVAPTADLHLRETFGPVAPLVHFTGEDDMHRLIAASRYGLHSGIFTRDVEHGLALAETLRAGHVNINDTSAYWETSIPAGGAAGADSGVGRSGGPWSVMEMSEVQTFTIDIAR